MQGLKAPFVVGLQITGYCNLACQYCYASNASRQHLALEDAINVSRELLDLGIFSISIEGGEPLLHPKWYEITKPIADAGIEVALITNGTLCDDGILDKLDDLSDSSEFFTIQVSLDSHVPNVNDILRGRGATVLRNIEKMVSANLDIAIASVVHRYNINLLFDLIEALYPAVKRFHFMNLMRISKFKSNDTSFFPDNEQISRFWGKMLKFRDNNPDISISTPFNDLNISLGPGTLECEGCTAGLTRATITPDLKVLPCGICDACWVMGDLTQSAFQTVWRSHDAEHVRRLKTPPCKIVKQRSDEDASKPDKKLVRAVDSMWGEDSV